MVHSTPVPPKEQPNVALHRDRQTSDEVCKNSRDTERLLGNMSKTSQAPQRIPTCMCFSTKLTIARSRYDSNAALLTPFYLFFSLFPARPGKVVGPVMPYENGSLKDAYDPRRLIRNPVLPPHPAIPPAYCFHRTTDKSGNSDRETAEVEREYIQQHKPPQQYIPGKMAPDIALDMRASPFFLSGGTRADAADRITMEANLLQAKSPYNGIAAAAAAAAAGAHRKVGAVQFGMSRMY